jgi:two-component system OmpR family sensor kinase
MRDLSIRWQLTAAYVALLVVTLTGAAVFVYNRAEAAMRSNALSDLKRDVAMAWTIGNAPAYKGSPEVISLDFAKQLLSRDTLISVYRPTGELILSESGKTLNTSPTPPRPSQEELTLAKQGTASTRMVVSDGQRILLVVMPLMQLPQKPDLPAGVPPSERELPKEAAAIAAVGVSLATIDANLADLRQALVLAILLAGAAGVAVGIFLTRRLLQPLDQVSATAQRIAAGDLSARVAHAVPGLPARRHELGRLAAVFDHMVEQLAATVTAQRRFVADAAHELKTPLTAIGGMVELLLLGADGGDPERRQRALTGIEREVGRLGRLVQDLLTLSRLESAESPRPAREPVDLTALAAEVVQEGRLAAGGQEIRLDVHGQRDAVGADGAAPLAYAAPALPRQTPPPVVVAGDSDRLKQVLLNLVGNAIKHTPPGGQVTVYCGTRGGQAEVRVVDTGAGIPAEAIPHLFDRFYRVERGRERKTGGAGLGLAIAQAIVKAHGGSLSAASDGPGRGATFTLQLPLAAPRPVPSAGLPLPTPQTAPAA